MRAEGSRVQKESRAVPFERVRVLRGQKLVSGNGKILSWMVTYGSGDERIECVRDYGLDPRSR